MNALLLLANNLVFTSAVELRLVVTVRGRL